MLQLFLVLFFIIIVSSQRSNVCKTLNDYNLIHNNSNCWYNPDVDLLVPGIIKTHGYPFEEYKVKTKDGYLLRLFRIPFTNTQTWPKPKGSKQPVFLQHGIFASSAPFVLIGNKSLAFRLSDSGYDVWLGNSRGSFYAKGHVTLSTDDPRYWDFSYHEMGIYDLPSSLDIVSQVTGRKDIIYIGQSMGTNIPYVYASMLPNHAKQRLKLIISLAPTVFVGSLKTVFRVWTPYEKRIKILLENMKVNELLPLTNDAKRMTSAMCLKNGYSMRFCEKLMYAIFGFGYENFLPELFPVLFGHYPAGSSAKTTMHLAQGVNTNQFRQYDYGPIGNYINYKTNYPPDYNLSSIRIPHCVMYGTNDFLGTEEGALKLYNKLPNRAGLAVLRNYNHVDFFFARNVGSVMHDKIIRIINKFT